MLSIEDYKKEIEVMCRDTAELNGMSETEYEHEMLLRSLKKSFKEKTKPQDLMLNVRRRYILLNPVVYQRSTPNAIYSESTLYLLIDCDEMFGVEL